MERERENLSHDEQRVADLLGTLRRVDAPGDFDTRVRARIAEQRDAKARISWRPVLAGGVALVFFAFAVYIGLRSINSGAGSVTQEVANTKVTAPMPVAADQPSVTPPSPAAQQENPPAVAATRPPTVGSNDPAPKAGGGSFDEASKDTRKLFPKTFDSAPRKNGDTGGLGGQIPVTMLFEAIGVHASWSGSGWHVDSVDSKNVAGRSGMKPGDVIEALDGQPVGEKTTFKAAVTGKSVRVRRDGAVLDLPFKP